MARRFTIEILMDLAKAIGANPSKFMGTKTNITFLGKGPTKNPLFQNRLAGLENASVQNLGKPETLVSAVEDAMSFASAGKLNNIQTEILGHNLLGIKNIIKPPPLPTLPMASVTPIRSGIQTVAPKPMTDIERLMKHGHTDARGRQWNLGTQETGPAAYTAALNQKTGMSRAIARQILQQDTRINLEPAEHYSLVTGSKGPDPLDLMKKYYGRSMMNLDAWLDDFLPRTTLPPRDLASRVLNEVELIPQFAEGGLAEILQAPRSGYSKGRLVKSALAILNRNKKNADYMFKASDNVSPGYARGDIKYNAELLADQLAEDAGVLYEDLGALEQTKFYGTAYDYLAKEMGQHLLQKRMMKDIGQKMVLSDFSVKGRKPSASGGLARILEV